MRALVVLMILAFKCKSVIGHSYGAVPAEGVCNTMSPVHGYVGQTSSTPYEMVFSSNEVNGGNRVQITLRDPRAVGRKGFKGFLVKAVNSADESKIVGTFDILSSSNGNVSLIECNTGIKNAITHPSSILKNEVVFDWIAPYGLAGNVKFVYTVVEKLDTFWVAGKSAEISVTLNTGTPSVGSSSSAGTTSLQTAGTAGTGATTAPVAPTDIYAGCGTQKGCFGDLTNCIASKSCNMIATYRLGNDSKVLFELQGKFRKYVALGLSENDKMGDDSVTECVCSSPNHGQSVYMSYNTGYSNSRLSPQAGLSEMDVSYVDGTCRCRFKRDLVTQIKGETFDLLSKSYYLMLAQGDIGPGDAIHQHSDVPSVSEGKINVTESRLAGSDSDPSIKIHGCLMVTAWICTVSIAIFLARYYKDMWPEVKHCREKVWFAWHRGLNMVTVVLTLAAFILIFVYIDGFTPQAVWEKNPHPILGCITVGLMCIQPLMAFFRPHPGTPKRPIFNWAHYIVGMVTYILAIITIFFAVTLSKAQLPDFFWWVLISFVGFDIIMFIVMEVSICVEGRTPAHNQIAMKDYSSNGHSYGISDISPEPQGARFKEVMLVLYLVGVTCFTAALIVIIAMSPF